MGVYDYLDKLHGNDLHLFKRCVRRLLDCTFIVEDREPNLFSYLAVPSNQMDMSNYLQFMGYDLEVDTQLKYAMLIQRAEDKDVVGIKTSNHKDFSKKEVACLLVLWEMFLDRFGKETWVHVEFGDIIEMQKQYGIHLTPNEVRVALALFRRFSLINYKEKDLQASSEITLYPTLQFMMDKEQFITVVHEVEQRFTLNEESETIESDEENDEYDECNEYE